MDMLGRDSLTLEAQVFGGAGVGGNDAIEAIVAGGADRGFDAHMGHHASNEQAANLVIVQVLPQPGLAEAVGEVLLDNSFSSHRLDARVDLRAGGIGQEDLRSWMDGKMLDMDDGLPGAAEGFKEATRLPAGFQAAMQLVFPAGEIVILDVNQYQGGLL